MDGEVFELNFWCFKTDGSMKVEGNAFCGVKEAFIELIEVKKSSESSFTKLYKPHWIAKTTSSY